MQLLLVEDITEIEEQDTLVVNGVPTNNGSCVGRVRVAALTPVSSEIQNGASNTTESDQASIVPLSTKETKHDLQPQTQLNSTLLKLINELARLVSRLDSQNENGMRA
jgi:hypothetical protein